MGLSHRKEPDGGDRIDGEIAGMRFVALYGLDGKMLSGHRSNAPPMPTPVEEAPAQPKLTIWQILTGSRALVKAHGGIDPVDDETYYERRGKCLRCENYDFGVCGGEKGCGCYLAAKIRVRGEKCPIGKW